MATRKVALYSGLCGLTIIGLIDGSLGVHAATVETIYTFSGGEKAQPGGLLLADSAGNLYGTADEGGSYKLGSVFEFSPPEVGKTAWTEKTLYSFGHTDSDGSLPDGTLVMDASGRLYGVGDGLGNGFVYQLSPPEAGHTVWTEKLLHVFPYPGKFGTIGALTIDADGNLYGVGPYDAPDNSGSAFRLSPPTAGGTVWGLTILHQFTGLDGSSPNGGLLLGKNGVLYGTTRNGGAHNRGAVFQLTPPAAGHTVWTEKVLYSFEGYTQGCYPEGSLVADSSGALYGSLMSGENEPGVIFKLTPPAAGHTVWTESIIYKFSEQDPSSGLAPDGSLAFDASGALYGETVSGGTSKSGVLFKLTPPPAGTARWTETVLMNMGAVGGYHYIGGVSADQNGNVFGYTPASGTSLSATAFEITP